MKLALNRLAQSEIVTSELRTMLVQVVLAALYYEPMTMFQSLMNMPFTESDPHPAFDVFLKQWFTDMDCFIG